MSIARISAAIQKTISLSLSLFKCRFPLLLIFLAFLLLPSPAVFSAQIKLAWDPNTEPDLAGYKVYYGTTSHAYGTPINVGNVTTYTLTGLTLGQTYYIALKAYDTSSNESGLSNEVSGAATDPAQTHPYTFTSNPAGLQITVDGTTYNAPQTFNWTAGSSHTISSPSPQGGTGTRYVFASWSDGGVQSHTITAPSTSTTYTVNLATQYSLTTSASPSGGGTVSPSGMNWYNSGQNVSVSTTANPGYSFSNWTGGLSGSANPGSVTMSSAKSVTANFTQNQYTLTVNISPSGSGSVTKNPNKSTYVYGEQVTLTATANAGYSFGSWSGDASGTNNPMTLTINGNKVVTANFTTASETVSTPSTPAGPISGITGTGYSFTAGGATSNLGHTVEYQFDWKGDGTDLSSWGPSGQSKTWTLAGTYQVRARARCATHTSVVSGWSNGLSVSINPTGVSCTVATNPIGLQITVDGSNYTGPRAFSWLPGSSHTVTVASPQTAGGARYLYSSWSDGGTQSHSITAPSSSTTYTVNFTTQYSLTTSVSPSGGGTVSPSGANWYNAGQSVSVSAAASAGYSFSNWTGDLTGSSTPASLNMSGPKSVTANFSPTTATQTYTVSTNISGLDINVDDSTYPAPKTFQWVPGSGHKLSALSPQKMTKGTRYTFSSWSDGGGQIHTVNVPSASSSYTANFKNQNKVKVSVSPADAGTVTLSSNGGTSGSIPIVLSKEKEEWYDDDDTVNLVAVANPGYSFSNWSGDYSGKNKSASLSTSKSMEIVANFVAASETVSTPTSPNGPVSGIPGTSYSYSTGEAISSLGHAVEYQFDWKGDGTDLSPWGPSSQSKAWPVVGVYSVRARAHCSVHPDIVSSWSTPLPVSISQTGISYTVATNPSGLQITIDGTTYTTPQTFNWALGSSHTLSAPVIQSGAPGTQYTYSSWSDGGLQTHTITTPSSSMTYTANFMTGYSLTTSVNPSAGGSVSGGGVSLSGVTWYRSGQNVSILASASTGYSFTGWSGDLSSLVNPTSIVMNGPKIITANFTSDLCSLTVNVDPPGSGVITRDPDKAIYAKGEQVTLTARANEGFNFKNWSSDAAGETNVVRMTIKGNMTAIANFVPSGPLEVIPSDGLSVSGRQGGDFGPSSQVYTIRNKGDIPIKWRVAKKPRWASLSLANGSLAPGETAEVTVSINDSIKQVRMGSYNAMVLFKNTARGGDSVSRSIALTVKPPIKTYTIKTNPDGLQVVVDGVPYVSPKTFDWEVGSSHTFEARTPQGSSPGSQYVFNSWSDRKPQIHDIVAPSRDTSYVANFKMQYALTTSVNSPDGGVVIPSGTNWFNQGQKVSVNAKPNGGYQFMNWAGDISGGGNPFTATIDRPMNLVANFEKAGAQAGLDSAQEAGNSKTNLPMIGELESPSEGRRVLGLKTIYGWALDSEGISRVRLFIDGEYVCDIPYGGLREDLKEDYPDYPNAEKSGFALIWNYSSLPPGVHVVQVEVQNMKGEVLSLSSNILVQKLSGEIITQVNPKEWLIPGINLAVDGSAKTYNLRLEWSNETQAFEIIDLLPQ